MKLIKCYVENFGTLSKYSLSFSDNLTIIKEDNGFGKSTLATFIKAMFYGLPKSKKSNLSENERVKYTPWQGGNFGGTLDFSHKNKTYRIERFFLTNGKEEFKLFDLENGKPCDDFSENIGVEIFGIDSNSFERSIYLKQQGHTTSMTNDFGAKLANLVENNDDISGYDVAMSALKKRRLYYSTQNGSRGALKDISTEIDSLEKNLADSKSALLDLETISSSINEKKAEMKGLEDRNQEVRTLIRTASSSALNTEIIKRKTELESELELAENKLSDMSLKYPLGLPENQQLSDISKLEKKLSELKISADILSKNVTDADTLLEINQKLGDNIPSVSFLNETKQILDDNETLQVKADTLKNQLDLNSTTPKKQSNTSVITTALFASITAAVGVALIFVNKIVAIILFVLAAFLLGVTGFLYLKNMIISSKNDSYNTKDTQTEYENIIQKILANNIKIEERISKLPSVYNKDTADIDALLTMIRDREKLVISENERNAKLNDLRQKISDTTNQIDNFFQNFGISTKENYADIIEEIKRDLVLASQLKNKPQEIKAKLLELPKIEESADTTLTAEDVENLTNEGKILDAKFSQISLEISNLESRKVSLVSKADALPEIEAELENKIVLKQEYSQTLTVIDTTIELLEKAREGLSSRYTNVVQSGFKKYAEIIAGEDIGDSLIDTELSLNLNRFGSQKELDYFSSGYKDMFEIAIRLALIDALYKDDQPPLILDDPFVNLDDERIKNSLKLLEKLANDRQILYLTCHSSRAI